MDVSRVFLASRGLLVAAAGSASKFWSERALGSFQGSMVDSRTQIFASWITTGDFCSVFGLRGPSMCPGAVQKTTRDEKPVPGKVSSLRQIVIVVVVDFCRRSSFSDCALRAPFSGPGARRGEARARDRYRRWGRGLPGNPEPSAPGDAKTCNGRCKQ